ncbi:MAG: hypothetical protein DI537_10165 [Stutzerimonas stutzeri]|nr:MAG: hypothetical protein DI537_10165 [Stutzerimonas stutzeri]
MYVGTRFVKDPNGTICSLKGYSTANQGDDNLMDIARPYTNVMLDMEYFNFAKSYLKLYPDRIPGANACIHKTTIER